MKIYILLHCIAVLATISLALSCASYFSGKSVKTHLKHFVEHPVAHPIHFANPTLIGPRIPMKATYVADPTDMKTGDCKQ